MAGATDRFGAQLFATYSDSKSPRGPAELTPPCFLPDSFVIVDVVSWWKITDATVRAGVFNVSDEKYWWWSDVRGLLRARSGCVQSARTQRQCVAVRPLLIRQDVTT